MASPGTWVAGDVLTAAEMNDLPGGVLAFASANSTTTVNSTSETDITGLSVTFNVRDGRTYGVYASLTANSAANDDEIVVSFVIDDGGSGLQLQTTRVFMKTTGNAYAARFVYCFTASATTAQRYYIRARRASGSTAVALGGTTFDIANIHAVDLGVI